MPTNIITKFDTLSLMLIHWKIQVTERTRLILVNSRAITPKCLTGSGWLSNLAKIFCQKTFSQSLMIIQWKLFIKLLSWQMLWTPLAAVPVPIIRPIFSSGRIKRKTKVILFCGSSDLPGFTKELTWQGLDDFNCWFYLHY